MGPTALDAPGHDRMPELVVKLLEGSFEGTRTSPRGTLKYADGRVYEGEFGVKASHGFRG